MWVCPINPPAEEKKETYHYQTTDLECVNPGRNNTYRYPAPGSDARLIWVKTWELDFIFGSHPRLQTNALPTTDSLCSDVKPLVLLPLAGAILNLLFRARPRLQYPNPRLPEPSALGEILSFGIWMQKEGYKPHTIQSATSSLKSIGRRTKLLDVEAVKGYLASTQISEARKEILALHLARFYRHLGIPFDRPRYRRVVNLPFIPLETEVDQLIGGVGRKTAVFLQLLKETGMRPGEAWNLNWNDIDLEKGTVNITPEKNSRPRVLKISSQTIVMLNRLAKKSPLIFHALEADPVKSLNFFRRSFDRQRLQIAEKLENSRISLISFKTLRHFKATMEYHRTKDILHVMHMLGHRSLRNTLVYTHLIDFESDEYSCKVGKTVGEVTMLIEDGFDYVTEMEGAKLFRKRR